MGVNAASSVTSDPASLYTNTTARVPTQTLNQDDFLKLLVAQLTSQDPMKPVSSTDFVAQMAQFTSLEQARTMSDTMTQLNQQQQLLQANDLIGREVSLLDSDGNAVQGLVTAVAMDQGTPLIAVNGQLYDLSTLAGVTLPPPTSTTSSQTSNQ